MDWQQSLTKLRSGKETWNEWANQKLDEKKVLIKNGEWERGKDKWQNESEVTFKDISISSRDINLETTEEIGEALDLSSLIFPWIANFNSVAFQAAINFSNCHFHGDVNFNIKCERLVSFSGCTFESDFLFELDNQQCPKFIFDNAVCMGEVSLKNIHFNKECSFERSELNNLALDGSIFYNPVYFNGLKVSGNSNFKSCRFTHITDLLNVQFGNNSNFSSAKFEEGAKLENVEFQGTLELSNAKFPKIAYFKNVKILKQSNFSNTTFKGKTEFQDVKFHEDANFEAADFLKDTSFANVVFQGSCNFQNAQFNSKIDLKGAEFLGDANFTGFECQNVANFSDVIFSGRANFHNSNFRDFAIFHRVKFKSDSDFTGLEAKRLIDFAEAEFKFVPDFTLIEANTPKPRLDNITVEQVLKIKQEFKDSADPRSRLLRWLKVSPDKETAIKYRQLKRYAIEEHNHILELDSFIEEVRARRFWYDKPTKFSEGVGRFWWGLLYGLFSDYGRSIWRPLLGWSAVFCLFSFVYYGLAVENKLKVCSASTNIHPRQAAYTIAAKNSLLFLGADRTDKIKRAYGCLYGWSPLVPEKQTASDLRTKTGFNGLNANSKQMAPNVPWAVSVYGIIHSILSLSLIFLLLLAIRNQFKIK